MSESLHLFTAGLFSKWGFNDGDVPDALLDYCDEHGLPYPDDWHVRLRHLVRTRLVPALDADVRVYDIETTHNPIRAESVNGDPVPDEVIYGKAEAAYKIEPQWVTVAYADVLAAEL